MRSWVVALVACFIGFGVGSLVWLSVFEDAHSWNRSLSQEHRGAEWVGQNPALPPTHPIQFHTQSSGCLRVDRAYVNGDTLTVLLTRICGESGDYAELHWRAVAGNTVISSNYENWKVDGVGQGEDEIVELSDYRSDPRVTDVFVSTKRGN